MHIFTINMALNGPIFSPSSLNPTTSHPVALLITVILFSTLDLFCGCLAVTIMTIYMPLAFLDSTLFSTEKFDLCLRAGVCLAAEVDRQQMLSEAGDAAIQRQPRCR